MEWMDKDRMAVMQNINHEALESHSKIVESIVTEEFSGKINIK